MPNTYTQIDIQLVFAVKRRSNLIKKEWKHELYKYITGIVQNNKHKMLRINGMSDHIHIFIGYNPSHPLPKLVEEIKTSSNKYIKHFRWKLQLANRLWSIFISYFTTGYGNQLH